MKTLAAQLRKNPMIDTLLSLRGNPRACLYTEPLWGIPYNLYMPFVSVYMAALGLSPIQIGLTSTLVFASQMVWALLSGVLTDKLGRRKTTLIFDLLSWSVPSLLWMLAQDFRWFVVAAVFNGAWRVTETSWGLLLVEDAPNDKLVHFFSITSIAGQIAGFVAPIAYFFVKRYSVVPTMRFLYGLTFVMMTAKFIILYFATTETTVGRRRMEETKNIGLLQRLWDGRKVLTRMLHTKRTMLTVAFIACFSGMTNVNGTFWPLLVTEKLGIAAENLSIFSTIKTLLLLLFYFTLVPKLDIRKFKNPMVLALGLMLTQQALMLLMSPGAYGLVLLSVVLEAAALSMLQPMSSSLQMINIDREERARMLGFFYALCMLFTAPLSTLAGALAEINRVWPFYLNVGLTVGAMVITTLLWRLGLGEMEEEAQEADVAV